jgi:uncharacterized RDD family membrane protein YckC
MLRMAWKDQPLDTALHVVTPENIAFEYRLAGPFRRLPAFLVDCCVRIALQLGLAVLIFSTVGTLSGGLAGSLFLLLYFVIDWFYGVLFETFWNGQTPGKYVLGLRALSDNGQPINGMQAALRNIFRAADIMFGLGCLVVAALNRKYQRLGDLVAGTIVVVEERQWLTGVAQLDDPRAIQLAAYLPPNFVVTRSMARALATYVERRRFFSPARRREVARHLAEPLLQRFGLPADTSYDLLLCALYHRTFIADRSQDERLLAEAQASLAERGKPSPPRAGGPPSPPAAALSQEQMVGTGFGHGRGT